MKRITLITFLILVVCLVAGALSAAPFVTPGMIRRNGLTDEQYQRLWSIGKNPKIDQAAARDLMFRASRFNNVTNWLDICGKTNDFAKLSYDLQDKNFNLAATNTVLIATNRQLSATCERLADEVYYQWENYTNQLAQTTAYSNLYNIASAQAQAATAKIQDEIADLQAKIVSYEEDKQDWIKKMPLFEKTITNYFNAKITDAENRIKILQALTGAN